MLTSNPIFRFALIHEVIFHGLFEITLHGFRLGLLSEKIADVNRSFKLYYAKAREILDCHASYA